MRFSTVLEEIGARPVYLLAALVVMLLVLHVILVKWLRLDDIAWKRVDYIWLAAAALGLLATSAQSERFLAKRYLDNLERPRTVTAYQVLHALLSEAYVCPLAGQLPHVSQKSDPFASEQAQFCILAQENAARMPKTFELEFLPLEQTGFVPFATVAHYPQTLQFSREVAEAAQNYKAQQQRFAELFKATQLSDGELVFTILGPLLVAFALALRITKVTGDIANARRKTAA